MAFRGVHPDRTTTVYVPENHLPIHLQYCEQGCDSDGSARCDTGKALEKFPQRSRDEQVAVEIGFWPPRESERFAAIRDNLRQLSQEILENEGPEKALRVAVEEASGYRYDYIQEGVAYAVRGWDGFELEDGSPVSPEFETVEIDGRKHSKLTPESLEILAVNQLLTPLFIKALNYNHFTEDEKKTSDTPSKSSSSTPRTAAGSATRNGSPTPRKGGSSGTKKPGGSSTARSKKQAAKPSS